MTTVLGTIDKVLICRFLLAIAFFYVGHICSATAQNAFNSYYCGESHDLSASVWQVFGVLSTLIGGFILIFVVMTAIPSDGITFKVKNTMAPAQTKSLTELCFDKFSNKLDNLEKEMNELTDDVKPASSELEL